MIDLKQAPSGKLKTITTVGLTIALNTFFCSGSPRFTHSINSDDTGNVSSRSSGGLNPNSFITEKKGDYYQTGMATYYADRFHGRKTASGERYNKYKFTAAHRTLPFGTVVKVTSMLNGKSVTVRINDRMPQKRKGDRIIDLSRAAAKTLGMVRSGVVPVGIEIVKE